MSIEFYWGVVLALAFAGLTVLCIWDGDRAEKRMKRSAEDDKNDS